MNRLTFFRTLATLVACLALAFPSSAYDFAKDGIYYLINGTNALVTFKDTNYNSYSGTVIIPSTVTYNGTTYNVVQINPYAFKDCTGLKRVILPPTIKYMMNYAFQNCTGLTNITLPADFYACYSYVFDGCTNLKSVICLSPTARSWNTNNFPESVLSNATLIVPQGKKAAYQAAGGCLSAFTDIQEMDCDFAEDAIFYKDLGNNKVAITHALRFAEDYSGNIEVPDVVVHNDTSYNVTEVGNEAFYYGHELYSVKLPPTVSAIDTYAFYDCFNLTQVNIPEGVEYINYCTFGGCLALQEIIIPSSVTWIAQNAFSSCNNLTNVTCRATTPPLCASSSSSFPTTAYSNATLYVPSLALNAYQTADVWKDFSHIAASTYDFTYDNLQFVITSATTAKVVGHVLPSPAGYYAIPSTANGYNVTEVGDYAFQNCNQLTEISIGDNVVTIGRVAFAGCSGLTSLTIPNSVTSIDMAAFMGCSGLTSVVIPNSVTYVGGMAFSDCSSLTSVIIGENCRFNTSYSWASNVFKGCTGLTSVTSLSPEAWNMDADNFEQTVYDNAQLWVPRGSKSSYQSTDSWNQFSSIKELEYDFEYEGIYYNITGSNTVEVTCRTSNYNSYSGAVYIPEIVPYNGKPYTVTAIGQNAFKMSKSLTRVVMPNTIRSINAYAFHYCEGLTEVAIPNSVQTIGNNAFWLCLNLKKVVIPHSVQTIGSMAFRNCSELTSVEIGENVSSIGSTCFYYCSKITEVTCHALTPPTLNEPNSDYNTTFMPEVYNTAVLNIPQTSRTAYQNALGWKKFTHLEAFATLDDVLNVDGGNIHFTSVGDYPWYTMYDGGRMLAKSGNSGIHSSSSVMTATVNLNRPGVLSFDFKAWGEGSDPVWDICCFAIDGVNQFIYGAYDNDWETYSVSLSEGTHTLSWSYIKDSSVNATGDYFAVDNVAITLGDAERGDVNADGQVNIADVTALIDYLLSGDESTVDLDASDANQDGSINIADVTSLIDYLLSGAWPEPKPIDLWYLTGDRVGSNPWENQGVSSIGRGLIPLYPVGGFDENGEGQLSYTGFFGANDAVMLIHHPGSKDDCWGYKPSGIFGHGGEEITAIKTGQDGYFNIMLNTKTDSFYFYPYNSTAMMFNTINIVGYHSDWAVTDPTYNMTKLNPEKENHNWIFRNFTLANDSEVKFAADNDWSNNWGAETFPFGRGVQDGVNIPVKAGTYDVYFNDITGDYNFIKK